MTNNRNLTKLKILLFIIIFSFGFIFRFINLGYSDFQPDEIGAQSFLFSTEPFLNHIISRSIGPIQFFITKTSNNLLFLANDIEFFIRFPFFVFGILFLFLAFLIINKHFNYETAIINLFLIGFSGYFIVFSRLTQYQSVLLFFNFLAFLFFLDYLKNQNIYKLVYSGIFSSLGVLSHYDMFPFIFTIILFLIYKKEYKHTIVYSLIVAVFGISYYIFQLFLPQNTFFSNYILSDRLVNSGFSYDSIFHWVNLFLIYHPKELLLFLILMFFLSFFSTLYKSPRIIFVIFFAVLITRYFFQINNLFFVLISALLLVYLTYILLTTEKLKASQKFVFLWFNVSFLFYGLIFSKPMTHIYVFLVPLYILISNYISYKNKTKTLYFIVALILITLISLLSFNFNAFINTNSNYPFIKNDYIFGEMGLKDTALLKEIGSNLGLGFGFLYNRNWNEISADFNQLVQKGIGNGYFSNEHKRITQYYFNDFKRYNGSGGLIVNIKNPYSGKEEIIGRELLIKKENYEIYIN